MRRSHASEPSLSMCDPMGLSTQPPISLCPTTFSRSPTALLTLRSVRTERSRLSNAMSTAEAFDRAEQTHRFRRPHLWRERFLFKRAIQAPFSIALPRCRKTSGGIADEGERPLSHAIPHPST